MQFDNPYGTLRGKIILVNDSSDFRIPYETGSALNLEFYHWRFHRLKNSPAHLYQVRVGDSAAFGRGGYG